MSAEMSMAVVDLIAAGLTQRPSEQGVCGGRIVLHLSLGGQAVLAVGSVGGGVVFERGVRGGG